MRLRGGLHANEGRVEVFLNGEWGTICDNGWSKQDAHVACKQLGFSAGALKAVRGAFYGVGDGKIWLKEVRCTGSELSLISCDQGESNGRSCSHYQDAGVVCLSKQLTMKLHDCDLMCLQDTI